MKLRVSNKYDIIEAEPTSQTTWYHLTDKAKFKLNPKYAPEDNSISIYDRSGRPGIYLATDVEKWLHGYGYWRPFVVEFHVDPSVMKDPKVHGRWGGEMFVPASLYDKLTIKREIPLDAYCREKYGEPGWIETWHEAEFDTGKPLDRKVHNQFHGYHYAGKDVRDMSQEEVKELKKQFKEARKHLGG